MKFPNIYRSFPDKILKSSKLRKKLKIQLIIFIYLFLISSIFIFSLNLLANYRRHQNILVKKEEIRNEIKSWENVISKFKDYKEGYYNIAILYFELGDIEKSKYYINKSLLLDPNFKKAKDFEEILKLY